MKTHKIKRKKNQSAAIEKVREKERRNKSTHNIDRKLYSVSYVEQ